LGGGEFTTKKTKQKRWVTNQKLNLGKPGGGGETAGKKLGKRLPLRNPTVKSSSHLKRGRLSGEKMAQGGPGKKKGSECDYYGRGGKQKMDVARATYSLEKRATRY